MTRFLTEQDFKDLERNRPDGLSISNHADHANELAEMKEGNIFGVFGYLYSSKPGDVETCNCKLKNDSTHKSVDYHIWIGFNADEAQQAAALSDTSPQMRMLKRKCIVVEMTPHYRAEEHPGKWPLNKLKQVQGKQVKVIGQLLIDNDHITTKDDCGKPGADMTKCWRMTVWEIHPVIQFFVCDSNTPCEQDSLGWKKLDDI